MYRSIIKTMVLAGSALLIAISLVYFPEPAVDAAISGLKLWWNIVFPSLLPFFIISELLIGFGTVTFIGVLLEPIMRPIFKVPGVGAFVFAMGMCSGFPAGAKITARLYEEKKISKTEAERLASFTNFSNPLFMFGAVAVGFFHRSSLGLIFALSHYIGNVCVGLIMRFYKRHEHASMPDNRIQAGRIAVAFRRMHRERVNNKRPIGQMLGDAVQSSMSTLLMVGGFIILFSVFNKLLDEIGGMTLIAAAFSHGLHWMGMSSELGEAIVPGLFEITVGAQRISETGAPLPEAVAATAFILGFGGFSIQAQVASILSQAKLSAKPFFAGRLLHGVFSALSAGVLYRWLAVSEASGARTLAVTGPVLSEWPAAAPEMVRIGSLMTLIALVGYILFKARRYLKEVER